MDFIKHLKDEYQKIENGKKHSIFLTKSLQEQKSFLQENSFNFLSSTDPEVHSIDAFLWYLWWLLILKGRTILHHAADFGMNDVVVLLLQFAKQETSKLKQKDSLFKYQRHATLLDINQRDNNHMTALHCALCSRFFCFSCSVDIPYRLISTGTF